MSTTRRTTRGQMVEATSEKGHWAWRQYQCRQAEAAATDENTHKLTAALLKSARPVEVYRCVLKQRDGEASAKLEPFSTDYSWLNVEPEYEGFDPAGINGPTYYRVARNPTDGKLYYFSTIRKPDGTTVLLMTDLDESDRIQPPIKE
jgi:hypothetical protein